MVRGQKEKKRRKTKEKEAAKVGSCS